MVGIISRANKKRVPIAPVGTDTAKGSIFARLRQESPGPGFMHFPATRDQQYFLGLTAERAVTRYRKGFPYREWVKVRERNEPLDCRVYAMAALDLLGCDLDKLSKALETTAERARKAVREAAAEIRALDAESAAVNTIATSAQKRRARRGRSRSWVTGWRR